MSSRSSISEYCFETGSEGGNSFSSHEDISENTEYSCHTTSDTNTEPFRSPGLIRSPVSSEWTVGIDLGASYTKIVFQSRHETRVLDVSEEDRGIVALAPSGQFEFGIKAAYSPFYLPGALKYGIFSRQRRRQILKVWKDKVLSTGFPKFADRPTILDLMDAQCDEMIRTYLRTQIKPKVYAFMLRNPGHIRHIILTVPNKLHLDKGHVKQIEKYKRAVQEELSLPTANFPSDIALEGEALAGYQLYLEESENRTALGHQSLVVFDCGHSSIDVAFFSWSTNQRGMARGIQARYAECDAGLLLLESLVFLKIMEQDLPYSTKKELVRSWDGKRAMFNSHEPLLLVGSDPSNRKAALVSIPARDVSRILKTTVEDEIRRLCASETLEDAFNLYAPAIIISGGGSRVSCIRDFLLSHLPERQGTKPVVVKEQIECIKGALYLFLTSLDFTDFLEDEVFRIVDKHRNTTMLRRRKGSTAGLTWGPARLDHEGTYTLHWGDDDNKSLALCFMTYCDGEFELTIKAGEEDDGQLILEQLNASEDDNTDLVIESSEGGMHRTRGRVIDVPIVYDRFNRNIFLKVD